MIELAIGFFIALGTAIVVVVALHEGARRDYEDQAGPPPGEE